jgi:hypothetical protein
MGLMVRTILVVGGIYVVSPVHTGDSVDLATRGASLLHDQSQRAAQAAAALCRQDREGCLAFGLQVLAQANGAAALPLPGHDERSGPATTAAARSLAPPQAPAPAIRPAANGRIARP